MPHHPRLLIAEAAEMHFGLGRKINYGVVHKITDKAIQPGLGIGHKERFVNSQDPIPNHATKPAQ